MGVAWLICHVVHLPRGSSLNVGMSNAGLLVVSGTPLVAPGLPKAPPAGGVNADFWTPAFPDRLRRRRKRARSTARAKAASTPITIPAIAPPESPLLLRRLHKPVTHQDRAGNTLGKKEERTIISSSSQCPRTSFNMIEGVNYPRSVTAILCCKGGLVGSEAIELPLDALQIKDRS